MFRSSKLSYALAWAQRGFRVFPLEVNGKNPVIAGFQNAASSDPTIITAWWRDPVTGGEREYNIGVLTTDMVVVDVDVKDNKPGLASYFGMGGHFETLVVETPTAGYHCYFKGTDSANTYPADGVDIRSHNGYVLAPGSTIQDYGTGEYSIAVEQAVASLPPSIAKLLRSPGQRKQEAVANAMDEPNAIALATSWLLTNAPLAIEGQGGDMETYTVACKMVRDFALSDETAFELLVRNWNDRCDPPWELEALWGKVQNASQYSIGAIGGALPETQFGGQVEIVEPPKVNGNTFTPPSLTFGNATEITLIPARPWLVHRLLMRGAVTVMSAAGAAGKTTLALTVAAHGAVGRDFATYKFPVPFKTVMYSAEEDRMELSRRLFSICQVYELDWATVNQGVMLVGSDDIPLTVATNVQRQPVSHKEHVEWLLDLARRPDVGLMILDPLVELHTCDENDTVQMRFVMSVLRVIAREGTVAILCPHHTSKGNGGSQGRAGNADISRGAGSIVNSARVALTLVAATDEDMIKFGIRYEDRQKYVRLDDAKMNLALANDHSVWFKKIGVALYNGDDVGVLHVTNMKDNTEAMNREIALLLAKEMSDQGRGSLSSMEAANTLKKANTLYNRMAQRDIALKIEMALNHPVQTAAGVVGFKVEGAKRTLVLE